MKNILRALLISCLIFGGCSKVIISTIDEVEAFTLEQQNVLEIVYSEAGEMKLENLSYQVPSDIADVVVGDGLTYQDCYEKINQIKAQLVDTFGHDLSELQVDESDVKEIHEDHLALAWKNKEKNVLIYLYDDGYIKVVHDDMRKAYRVDEKKLNKIIESENKSVNKVFSLGAMMIDALR